MLNLPFFALPRNERSKFMPNNLFKKWNITVLTIYNKKINLLFFWRRMEAKFLL